MEVIWVLQSPWGHSRDGPAFPEQKLPEHSEDQTLLPAWKAQHTEARQGLLGEGPGEGASHLSAHLLGAAPSTVRLQACLGAAATQVGEKCLEMTRVTASPTLGNQGRTAAIRQRLLGAGCVPGVSCPSHHRPVMKAKGSHLSLPHQETEAPGGNPLSRHTAR